MYTIPEEVIVFVVFIVGLLSALVGMEIERKATLRDLERIYRELADRAVVDSAPEMVRHVRRP